MTDKITKDGVMISYKGGPPFYTEEYYRGNNYKQQDGCHNCKHHYCQEEYDEPDRIYCTLHGDPMPLDNSVLASVERDYTTTPEPDLLVMTEAWEKWIVGRAVHNWGICDSWEVVDG